jgi:hypothetical protein
MPPVCFCPPLFDSDCPLSDLACFTLPVLCLTLPVPWLILSFHCLTLPVSFLTLSVLYLTVCHYLILPVYLSYLKTYCTVDPYPSAAATGPALGLIIPCCLPGRCVS